MTYGRKSLVLFPTKALAQDQLVKIQGILERNPKLATEHNVQVATLDGDTPHSQRALIVASCNIILSNPDTLHQSILPNWKTLYKEWIRGLKYVVIDEAHMYEGVFGAHVAMILARLYRIRCCSHDDVVENKDGTRNSSSLVFLACSATLAHPEHHFRLLCCIPAGQPVTVLTKDSSPRAAKHFFVWNPPLLDENGKSLGYVSWPKKKTNHRRKKPATDNSSSPSVLPLSSPPSPWIQTNPVYMDGPVELSWEPSEIEEKNNLRRKDIRRRHSADETALLLALAVKRGVRCIAFCKTRCLVEWVYERCIAHLQQCPTSRDLVSKVDSYRGGYTKLKRREIEEKLFNNHLLGVVGTSALELGVDIGGVEVTLHCGFPSSHASLMQQAGRAGRGAAASHRPSLAICVCFNSPIDQHLHRHPSSLLNKGLSAPQSMPIYSGLVQGHLLCAGKESPLTGDLNASSIRSVERPPSAELLSDTDLFGSQKVYKEALESLMSQGSVSRETVCVFGGKSISVYKTHPSIKFPWAKVSIRSIETVNYDIVDISHPMQANRMDGQHHEAAVMVSSTSAIIIFCIVSYMRICY
jgi:DEAD/DEAH box helicase domain-containing protein